MKHLLLAVSILMTMSAHAQNGAYAISKDAENGDLVFNGRVTFADLHKEPTFTWLKEGENEYKPDEQTMAVLKNKLAGYTMVIFLGTWCDDSHYLVPKLAKVLQLTGYPEANITMYGVDRQKTTKGGEEKKYQVTLVPTVILYDKSGKEAGRITESAQKSIEADLAATVQ